jgi:hypothetical protein
VIGVAGPDVRWFFLQGNALLRRLVRIGVLDESRLKLDFVLGLKVEDFLERRLQTQVFKAGLAKSVHHARVLIRQRHIRCVCAHVLSRSLLFVHSLSLSLSLPLFQSLLLSHSHTHSLSPSLSPSNTHTHTHTHTLSLSLSLSLCSTLIIHSTTVSRALRSYCVPTALVASL